MSITSTTLSSGLVAKIEPDPHVPGAYLLIVDGTPQSQVHPEQPWELFFEYVRRIGNVIDLLGCEGDPITAVHLGSGALTLPRYIAATRPDSRQQVIELEPKLVDLVREVLPLPKAAKIRLRYGDAREVVQKLPGGLSGNVDLLVSDIFAGACTPTHVTSVEYYRLLKPLLKPDGVLAVNVADGAGLGFGRSQVATIAEVFAHVAVLCDVSLLKGNRFGNLVLIASETEFPAAWQRLLTAGGPHPAKVMMKDEVTRFASGAQVVTDDIGYRGSLARISSFFEDLK